MMSTLSLAVPTYPAGLGDEPALLRAQAQLCGSSHDKHLDAPVLLPTEFSVVAGNRKDLPETFHLYVSGVALGAESDQLATHGVSPLPGQFKIGARAADIIGKAGQQHLRRRPIFL